MPEESKASKLPKPEAGSPVSGNQEIRLQQAAPLQVEMAQPLVQVCQRISVFLSQSPELPLCSSPPPLVPVPTNTQGES